MIDNINNISTNTSSANKVSRKEDPDTSAFLTALKKNLGTQKPSATDPAKTTDSSNDIDSNAQSQEINDINSKINQFIPSSISEPEAPLDKLI